MSHEYTWLTACWHWNCKDCEAYGHGTLAVITVFIDRHQLDTRHDVTRWPRGRKDQTELLLGSGE